MRFLPGKVDTSPYIPAGVVELFTKKPEAPTQNQVAGLPSERQCLLGVVLDK